jgi:hypothetical protein
MKLSGSTVHFGPIMLSIALFAKISFPFARCGTSRNDKLFVFDYALPINHLNESNDPLNQKTLSSGQKAEYLNQFSAAMINRSRLLQKFKAFVPQRN